MNRKKILYVILPLFFMCLLGLSQSADAVQYGCTMQNISDDFLYFGAKAYFYTAEDEYELYDLSTNDAFLHDGIVENYNELDSDTEQITIYFYYANEDDTTKGDKINVRLQYKYGAEWLDWRIEVVQFQAEADETDIEHISFDFDGFCEANEVDLTEGEDFRIVIEEYTSGEFWFWNYFRSEAVAIDESPSPEAPSPDDGGDGSETGDGDSGGDGETNDGNDSNDNGNDDSTPTDDTTSEETSEEGREYFWRNLWEFILEKLNEVREDILEVI